ncbi:MAG: hypothetical protein ABSH32_17795 [Bryobacteraceae bacterium]|jgi:hypothetical protein
MPDFSARVRRFWTEAVRQYLLYLIEERKMSPEGVNQQVSAPKFLYLVTLDQRSGSSGDREPSAWLPVG